jgi:hypothetical protein
MYCIVALPKTASTLTWHIIDDALKRNNLNCDYGDIEPFNPYNKNYTPRLENQEIIYQRLLISKPLPLIKLLTNYNYNIFNWFNNSPYQLIFLKPKNIRKQILGSLIGNVTKNYFGIREERLELKGKLKFERYKIEQKVFAYKKHMRLERFCKYSFYDTEIITNPNYLLETLKLHKTETVYNNYTLPIISDDDMLEDIDEFNKLYEECINTL